MRYYIEDPDNQDSVIPVPEEVRTSIIIDYLQKTYYWSVALGCLIIGTFFGILIS